MGLKRLWCHACFAHSERGICRRHENGACPRAHEDWEARLGSCLRANRYGRCMMFWACGKISLMLRHWNSAKARWMLKLAGQGKESRKAGLRSSLWVFGAFFVTYIHTHSLHHTGSCVYYIGKKTRNFSQSEESKTISVLYNTTCIIHLHSQPMICMLRCFLISLQTPPPNSSQVKREGKKGSIHSLYSCTIS